MRLLVACGASAGISATFNAPVAGVFFSLELILRSFEAEMVAVILLSSVTADVIGRAAFGDHPFLVLPGFAVQSTRITASTSGSASSPRLSASPSPTSSSFEDAAERLLPVPRSLRPAIGGLALGCILFAVPELYGVGYPVLKGAVDGRYLVAFLVLLLVGKMPATSVTLAIGGSGGIFAPCLFIERRSAPHTGKRRMPWRRRSRGRRVPTGWSEWPPSLRRRQGPGHRDRDRLRG